MDTGQVLDALTRRSDRRQSRGFDVKYVDKLLYLGVCQMTFLPIIASMDGTSREQTMVAGRVGPLLAFPGLRLERTAHGGLRTCGGTERPRYKRTSQEAAIVCGMQASCHHLVLLSRARTMTGSKKSED